MENISTTLFPFLLLFCAITGLLLRDTIGRSLYVASAFLVFTIVAAKLTFQFESFWSDPDAVSLYAMSLWLSASNTTLYLYPNTLREDA